MAQATDIADLKDFESTCESRILVHIKTEDSTETFINAVKSFPCLYDPQHNSYKDIEAKRNAWLEVVRITGLKDDTTARLKWKRLRDYYKDCLWKFKTTTGQAAKRLKRWIYMDQMEFLKSRLIYPSLHTSITLDEDIEEEGSHDDENENDDKEKESDDETAWFIRRNNKRKTSDGLKETEKTTGEYFKKKIVDNQQPIDIYFQSIAETVKTLPPLSQNKIKLQVANLVFTEEQRVLEAQCQQL